MGTPRTNVEQMLAKMQGIRTSPASFITGSSKTVAKGILARPPASTRGTPLTEQSINPNQPLGRTASCLLTPKSSVGSPALASKGEDAVGSAVTSGSNSKENKGYNPKLDSADLERLKELRVEAMDRRMTLFEYKCSLDPVEADLTGEADLVNQQLEVLGNRINELKAAIAARNPPNTILSHPPRSSGSTAPSVTAHSTYPTPSTAGPRHEWTAIRPKGLSSDDSDHAPLFRPTHSNAQAGPSRRRQVSSPTPDFDPVDLTTAEEGFPLDDPDPNDEFVPPSTPPDIVPATPPRSTRTTLQLSNASRSAAIAELQELPFDEVFSSPVEVVSPNRLPRVKVSSARGALGGPGPSSSATKEQRVQAPQTRTVVVEKSICGPRK